MLSNSFCETLYSVQFISFIMLRVPIQDRRLEELAKSDRADASDYHIWHRKLPLKLRQVTRDEFLSEEYLDCDSCDEVDE